MSEQYYIVTKADCPWCDKAQRLLMDRGLTYTVYHLETSNGWGRLLMKTHGFKTVPQIFGENYELIGGYDQLDGYLNGNYKS